MIVDDYVDVDDIRDGYDVEEDKSDSDENDGV
jgi:hypothetical protein